MQRALRRLAGLVAVAAPACAGPRPGGDAELYDALLAPGEARSAALAEIAASGDRRWLAPLLDLLMLAPTDEAYVEALAAVDPLVGEDAWSFEHPWRELVELHGGEREPAPPEGYLGWKGELLARAVDPRYRELLPPGARAAIRPEEIQWGGVAVDGIPDLVEPDFVAGGEASWLEPDEPVFGLELAGDARAYPLRIVDWHEMVNDVVGGVPVALAWCTLCGAGILYDRRVAGRVLELGTSGLLLRSNKLMYDRATGTLWSQLTGEPAVGPLVGEVERLSVLPIELLRWDDWRRRHPRTRVLARETGHERRYEPGAAYGEYFAAPETMFPVWRRSAERAPKERVLVLRIAGDARAYPLAELVRAERPVHDAVGGEPVVVLHGDPHARAGGRAADARSLAGDARAWRSGGRRFRLDAEAGELVDETGGRWRITDAALGGPGGERLERVPGHLAFWFAWVAFHGDEGVWRAPD